MTTDQIVRIVLKRVDNIIKWNYNYLDESHEIRKEIYALLNDPVIKAEILNLKKEEVFKNKTDKIEELMEERKKERELLFKKISSARKEYNNNGTTEKTVKINLSDILREKQNTLEKEILDTKEVENYIHSDVSEHNIKIISAIENKKRELESIQSKLLKSHNSKNEIDKITKIFIELENLFKQLSNENKKEESNQEEKSTFKEKITSFIKEKILHEDKNEDNSEKKPVPEEKKEIIVHQKREKKESDIKYHENMNENPEIEEMEKSFKEKVQKDEKKIEENHKNTHIKEVKKTEEKKEDHKNTHIKEVKKTEEKNNCEEKDEELKEEREKEKELTEENSFLKKHLDELKVSIEAHRKLKEGFTNSKDREEIKKIEPKKEIKESKKEEEHKKEESKESKKEEHKKELKESKKEEESRESKKEEHKKESKENKKEEEHKENNKSHNFLEKFEEELKKMSKDLRRGIRKRYFTDNQYKSLIRKYPSLKEVEIKEKDGKIKFKFTKDEKKFLKK